MAEELKNYYVYIGYSDEHHIYFGITKSPSIRWGQHKVGNGSKEIKALIDKGFNFYFEILYSNLTEVEALKLEDSLILEYTNLGYKVLNKSIGPGSTLRTYNTGDKHINTKVSDSDVILIREEYSLRNVGMKDLATKYNVSLTTIHNIITGKTRSHLGGPISNDNKDRAKKRKLDLSDIYQLRQKYSKLTSKITFSSEGPLYGITGAYLSRLLRGVACPEAGGPILNKDYTW